ncbi:hypothetical protein [Burkholderia sp. 22PA0106]|uniref:hypothetical protein n=1 Tax=Burkholderia sp. 22PA0106 TaxID=3237371 RepID=UPI0039C42ECB
MTDLVSTTIAAHGGLDAWRGVERVSANFHASGVSLKQRGPVAEADNDQSAAHMPHEL